VLLDEPSAGLDGHETERLSVALRRTVIEEKVSLLLVEHDVSMVLRLSSEIYVLDFGSVIAQGPPAEIRENSEVRAAYLGDEDIAIASS
jgi:branched-chain amino acid transport system ATP-binding protein